MIYKQPLSNSTINSTIGKTSNRSLQIDYDYQRLMEGLPVAVCTCDAKGRITFYNEAAAELWGRRPVLGKDMWCGSSKIFTQNGALLLAGAYPMAQALKEGKPIKSEEIIIERPDGTKVNVLPNAKPIINAYGKLIGAINMMVDVTVERRAQEAIHRSEEKYRGLSETLVKKVAERTSFLKESEERYHKMIEEVQDYAILTMDKQGFILNWNKGAEKIKGYKEEEIVGKNFRLFYQDEDRKNNLPERLIKKATDEGRAMQEGWRLRKDGTRFWGSIVITALHDPNNNVIGFTKVTRDLTDRKMAEDQLKQYARELESQNKELEQFAYVASHDLQEPLRKIRTFGELIEQNSGNEALIQRNIEKINAAAKRMSTMIRDILTYSQLSKTDELFTLVDLNETLECAGENFELLIEEKGVKIRNGHLPIIKGIPIQLQQLFSNLLSNAIKFSGENPVIEIRSEAPVDEEVKHIPDPYARYTKIVFKDNGIGFEPRYRDQVFKLFERLDSSKSGTGIGLALCKKIVENHNGFITVASEPTKGTTFNIFLPVLA